MSAEQPPQTISRMKSKPRSLREEFAGLLVNVAEIKQFCEAASVRRGCRELITPEDAFSTHGLFLRRPYAVEDVAKVAAGCAGETPRDRIQAALELLAAAEDIANPNPWKKDVGPTAEELEAREREISEIIKEATSDAGEIGRVALCHAAFKRSGRWNGESEKTDASEKSFRDWVRDAADSYTRWELFRQIEDEPRPRCKAVEAAEKRLKRAERAGASMNEIWEAGRGVSLAISEQYTLLVDKLFGKLSAGDLKERRKKFLKLFESGKTGGKSVIHNERAARGMLLGEQEFTGLLEFLKPTKPKYKPTPPSTRDASGAFAEKQRTAEGKIKKRSDDTGIQEHSVPSDGQRRTHNPS